MKRKAEVASAHPTNESVKGARAAAKGGTRVSGLSLPKAFAALASQDDSAKLLEILLRHGGCIEHERMKLAGWAWLLDEGYPIIDFEIGGFDVLRIAPSLRREDFLRTVIDAKTSMQDLVHHFRKDSIPNCDVEGHGSWYADHHWILAPTGIIKPDAVHSPWGLLEYHNDTHLVVVAKKAERRIYLGDQQKDIEQIARRKTQFMHSFLLEPNVRLAIKRRIPGKILLNKDNAEKDLNALHGTLVKYCGAFEILYGYNPLAQAYTRRLRPK